MDQNWLRLGNIKTKFKSSKIYNKVFQIGQSVSNAPRAGHALSLSHTRRVTSAEKSAKKASQKCTRNKRKIKMQVTLRSLTACYYDLEMFSRGSSYIKFVRRIEKEKNALQAEGDDLAVSLETLQKQKVLHNAAVCVFLLLTNRLCTCCCCFI